MSTVPRRRSSVLSRRWTKTEYYRLGELGFFVGQRVELIEGRIMVLSPQGPPHTLAVDKTADALAAVFGAGYWVRRQYPLDLGQLVEPEPDVSVVPGDRAQYALAHPTSALLIVEVSDTTLSHDRRRKGSLYARGGVADYWIVNLRRRRLEVYRAPVADATARFGHRYSTRADLLPGATVNPLAAPAASIPVDDLLP